MSTEPTGTGKKLSIPESLKKVLDKLPTAEAIRVIEDIGEVAWVVDNNNNNNTKKGLFDERILENVSKLSPERIKTLLEEIE